MHHAVVHQRRHQPLGMNAEIFRRHRFLLAQVEMMAGPRQILSPSSVMRTRIEQLDMSAWIEVQALKLGHAFIGRSDDHARASSALNTLLLLLIARLILDQAENFDNRPK